VWLVLCVGLDAPPGPVSTLDEAAREFSSGDELGPAPRLGEHTDAWRVDLGL
jgi:hypothetical protein